MTMDTGAKTLNFIRRPITRRHGLLTMATGLSRYALSSRSEPVRAQATPPKDVSPDDAVQLLKEGNARYIKGDVNLSDFAADRVAHSLGQAPFAAILGCADSRVIPELAFHQSHGELFVIRVAGNIVNNDVLASLEYAIQFLDTRLIVVLGHSTCGAVKAAVEVVKNNTVLPGHLPGLVEPIIPAVKTAADMPGNMLANAIRENVINSIDEMQTTSLLLAAAVSSRQTKIVGAVYDIPSGKVDFL